MFKIILFLFYFAQDLVCFFNWKTHVCLQFWKILSYSPFEYCLSLTLCSITSGMPGRGMLDLTVLSLILLNVFYLFVTLGHIRGVISSEQFPGSLVFSSCDCVGPSCTPTFPCLYFYLQNQHFANFHVCLFPLHVPQFCCLQCYLFVHLLTLFVSSSFSCVVCIFGYVDELSHLKRQSLHETWTEESIQQNHFGVCFL